MKKSTLVFVPTPGIGHLVSTVEFAKRLIDRDDRLSIVILAVNLPSISISSGDYFHNPNISIIGLPMVAPPPLSLRSKNGEYFFSLFMENYKPKVREAVTTLLSSSSEPDSFHLIGFVLDLFCSSMIDVAHEFGVPSYVFFTSGAGFLGFVLNLPAAEFKEWDSEWLVPSYSNPVPLGVLPGFVFDEKDHGSFVDHATRYREAKGIIVNTFSELEPHAVGSFLKAGPPVYTVGPVLDMNGSVTLFQTNKAQHESIVEWLNKQPPSSVVFLCFGSMGCFDADQVREIAIGLEKSGYRFLWSLRKPPPEGKPGRPEDYTNPQEEVLPEGFLDRIGERGMICGWAPQLEVLAHPAIGAFVSHCGWNSILESVWFGVPIVAWPMYAEQQLNAFELVRDLGIAVEMRLDYRKGGGVFVTAEEVERGIRGAMEDGGGGEVRKRVMEMKEKSRAALMAENGSSYASLGHLVSDMMSLDLAN